MACFWFSACFVLLGATDGQEALPVDIELRADVLELVDGLDAPKLQQRKGAERALMRLGPGALRYLPDDAQASLSVEATERLGRVKTHLRLEKTQQDVERKVIRLADVRNLGEALEEISRASEVEFDYDASGVLPVTPVARPLAFWQALDLVLDQCELGIDFYASEGSTLKLVSRPASRPSRSDSAAYAGVYRIEPTSVTARRVLNQPDLSSLNINVEIAWEPHLTPIGLTVPVSELTGRLDDGATLKPQASGNNIDVSTSSELGMSEFFLPMLLPAGRPRKIDSLSGTLKALLPGETASFELELDEVNPSQKIASLAVAVEEYDRQDTLHAVRLGVTLENPQRALESHRQWIFENEVYIRRSDGSRADHLGYEVYRQARDGVGIRYLFDLGGAASGATLVYRSPTSVVPSEVPFVIQGIPLP